MPLDYGLPTRVVRGISTVPRAKECVPRATWQVPISDSHALQCWAGLLDE